VDCEHGHDHDPAHQLLHEARDKVMEWVGRVVSYEDTFEEVQPEMRDWVERDAQRLLLLTLASLGSLSGFMRGAATSHQGSLTVVQQGSWFMKSLGSTRDPDAVTAMQATIALLNRDREMVSDLLQAHLRVAGAPGLFGVAKAGMVALIGMAEPGGLIVETRKGPPPYGL
jgi:hypothetical protein